MKHFIVSHIFTMIASTLGDALKIVRHLYLAAPWGNHLVTIINTHLDIALRYLRAQAGHNRAYCRRNRKAVKSV